MSLLLVNKDATQNLDLSIVLPQAMSSATLQQMTQLSADATAPSLAALSGISIQGATVAIDGAFQPGTPYSLTLKRHAALLLRARTQRCPGPAHLAAHNGGTCTMPPSSAYAPFLTRLQICEDRTLRPCSDAFSPSCCSGRPCSPAFAPALTTGAMGQSTLPACCRRGGQHHCEMSPEVRALLLHEDDGSTRINAQPQECPYRHILWAPRICRRSPRVPPQRTRHSRCMSPRPPRRPNASAGSLSIAPAKNAALPPSSSPSTRTRPSNSYCPTAVSVRRAPLLCQSIVTPA